MQYINEIFGTIRLYFIIKLQTITTVQWLIASWILPLGLFVPPLNIILFKFIVDYMILD